MEFSFLSQLFFETYPSYKYPQLEQKTDRPYIHVVLKYNGIIFAIPLRSNIHHPHCFLTDKKNRCGVDYTKAVPIYNLDFLNKDLKVFIRPNEFKRLSGKQYRLEKEFEYYVNLYKKCKSNLTINHREDILRYSSLQYFEDYI